MNTGEIKMAMRNGFFVKLKNSDFAGTVSCLSDDETTAYIKENGASLFRCAIRIDLLELELTQKRKKETPCGTSQPKNN